MVKYTKINCRGNALLYVVMAFIVTGFIGMGMVKLAHTDRMGSTLSGSSESARLAVSGGFIHAQSWFSDPASNARDSVLEIINEWYKESLDGEIPDDEDEVYIPVTGMEATDDFIPMPGSSTQKYRVEIKGIDFRGLDRSEPLIVTLYSEGIGAGGSRSAALGTFALDGFKTDAVEIEILANALYLGSGGGEFDRPFRITGDAFINGGGMMYGGGNLASTISGNLVTGNTNKTLLIKHLKVGGAAYFQGPTEFQHIAASLPSLPSLSSSRQNEFQGGLGLDNAKTLEIGFGAEPAVGGNIYANTGTQIGIREYSPFQKILFTNTDPTKRELHIVNNDQIRHNMSGSGDRYAIPDLFEHYESVVSNSSGIPNIKEKLGVTIPPKIELDETVFQEVDKKAYTIGGNQHITGESMNELYSNKSTNYYTAPNGDKWLVLKYAGSSSIVTPSDPTLFTGKVIWIVTKNLRFNTKTYEHGSSGVSIFMVRSGGKLTDIGGMAQFNGFIYTENTGDLNVFKGLDGNTFNGGIYSKDDAAKMRIEGPPDGSSGYFSIVFDPDIMATVAATKLFKLDDGNPDPDDEEIILTTANRITTRTLSRSF